MLRASFPASAIERRAADSVSVHRRVLKGRPGSGHLFSAFSPSATSRRMASERERAVLGAAGQPPALIVDEGKFRRGVYSATGDAVSGAFDIDALFPEADGVCLEFRTFDGTPVRIHFQFTDGGKIRHNACAPGEQAA